MGARTSAAGSDRASHATGELDAFVSYARADAAVAERIVRLLERAGRAAWLDVDSIPAGAPWREELGTAIEAASAVIFVMTPRWVASAECRGEFVRARQLGKRLIPVRLEATEGVPRELAEIQWIDYQDGHDAELLAELLAAVDTDHAWVRSHTEWLARALRWEGAEHDPSLLARGADLRAGRAWAAGAAGHDPPPTALQLGFLAASRRRELRRRAALGSASVAALGVAVILSLVARGQHHDAAVQGAQAESRRLAASALTAVDDDPASALRLAVRAQAAAGTAQAASALRQTLLAFRLRGVQRVGAGPLARLALSPDGRTLAVADAAGHVTLDDAKTGSRRLTLADGRAVGTLLRYSGDGRWLLSAGVGRTVRVWRMPSGRLVAVLHARARVSDVATDRTGRLALVADGQGPARLWRLPDAVAVGAIGRRVVRAALSPAGDWAVVGERDGRVTGWSLEGPRTGRAIVRSNFRIASVQSAARGSALVVSDVGSAWLVRGGRRVELAGGADALGSRGIHAAAFSADGRLAVTGTYNGQVSVWNARTGQRVWQVSGHTGVVEQVGFSPDGRLVVSAGGSDGHDRLWDAGTGQARGSLVEPTGVRDIVFATDSRRVFSASADGRVRTWDATGQQVWEGPGIGPDVIDVAVSSAAGTLFAASRSGIFDIRDLATGALRLGPAECRVGAESCLSDGFESRLDATTLRQAAYAPDGGAVATVSDSGRAALWNARTGAQRAALGRGAAAALFSPDGGEIVITHGDGTVAVWSARPPVRLLRHLRTRLRNVLALAFVPGGRRLVATGEPAALTVLDAASGQRVGPVRRLAAPSGAVAAGPNGLLAAAQGSDISLWRRGLPGAVQLRGHTGDVTALAFSPDGSTLASAAADGTVRIWDVGHGALIGTLASSPSSLETVVFVDSAHIAAGGADGLVRVIDCDVCAPVGELLELARTRLG